MNNCPLGKKETHACWGCIYEQEHREPISGLLDGYVCTHPDYNKEKPIGMKKQYWISLEHNFKRRVILFEDVEPITYYAGFQADEFVAQAEREGYVKGYLQEDLEEARIVYERVKDNVLPIGYKELWELEEKMKK